jgi:hypothetical protein
MGQKFFGKILQSIFYTVSAVGGISIFLSADLYRKDLNYPPTAVGGISIFLSANLYRKDLNYPPPAVGGYFNFSFRRSL